MEEIKMIYAIIYFVGFFITLGSVDFKDSSNQESDTAMIVVALWPLSIPAILLFLLGEKIGEWLK